MEYDNSIRANGAIVGQGLQTLASVASSAGNSIDLSQGYQELAASRRAPLHPGHEGMIDRLKPAAFLDASK